MSAPGFHVNPFPGIRSYEISENDIFFGREEQVKELIDRFSATRFLAIVGSSGCGKSSLIRAGLIPSLIQKKTDRFEGEWRLFIMKPGNDPVGNLAKSISDRNIGQVATEDILRSGPDGIGKVLHESPEKTLNLLVIDQFEELFRYKNANSESDSLTDATIFVDLLMSAIHDPHCPVYVVLTMRTDFLDDCTEFRQLSEAINVGYYLVPRMNDEERQLAITGPIRYKKAEITQELLHQLLLDVGDNPDQLPILQHALMRTWDYWSLNRIGDQPIGIEHYEAIGTMKEALSIHLEEIYHELQDQRLRFLAERLFKALTDIGHDNRGTRRPAFLRDLCTLTEASEEDVIHVIDAFREPGRAFLMPPNHVRLNADSTIDISHESIMRVWKRLRGWVEDQNRSAQLYLRLAKSAELFQEGKSGLWVNPELQLALQWKEQNKPNATWAMRYDPAFDRAMAFLENSKKQRDLETERKERQQSKNLKRARYSAIFLGAASLVSILFLVISLNLRFKAEANRKEAMAKQAQAETERKKTQDQRKEAILQKRISEQQQEVAEQQKVITEQQRQYAVSQQLVAQAQTKIAIEERYKADIAKGEAIQAKDEAEEQRHEAISQKTIADQERIKAEASERNTQRLRLLSVARSLAIQAAQLAGSIQGDLPGLLALQAFLLNQENGGDPFDADIFAALSATNGKPVTLRGHRDAVRGIALSPDGKNLYSCSDDGKIFSWNSPFSSNPPTPVPLPKQIKDQFRNIILAQKGKYLVCGSFSGKVYLFRITGPGSSPLVLNGHNSVVYDLAADPVQDRFVTVGGDGKVLLWTGTGEGYNKSMLDSLPTILRSVSFHPDGRSLLFAGENGVVRLIRLSGSSAIPAATLHLPAGVLSVAFSPDGNNFAAGLSDGTMRIWNTGQPEEKPTEIIGSHQAGILGIAFSPDGKLLYSAGYDKTVTFLPVNAYEEKPSVAGSHEAWVYCIYPSPDGKQVFSCSSDKTIMIFSTSSQDLAGSLSRSLKRNLTDEEWDKYIGPDISFEKTVPGLP